MSIKEIRMILNAINSRIIKGGKWLKLEHENDYYYIRIYQGESMLSTLLGGSKPKELLTEIRAFYRGLLAYKEFTQGEN